MLTLSYSFSHQDTFSFSFSLVDENLLNFSFSFSHFQFQQLKYHTKMNAIILKLITHFITGVNIATAQSAYLSSIKASVCYYCSITVLLSAEQHAHFCGKLRPADEMSTKNSRILVSIFVLWSNFRHSFSFVDENQRFLVTVFVSMTKINLFSLTKFQFQFQSTKKTLLDMLSNL